MTVYFKTGATFDPAAVFLCPWLSAETRSGVFSAGRL